jgi:uncharacterized protein YprB with RNaseH-like and TPR domain
MENLLRRQLALIKSRARMLAGLAEDESSITTDEDPALPLSAAAAASESSPVTVVAAGSVPSHPNPVIDAALKSGAVTRGSDMPVVTRLKRGPWWWRRRIIRDTAPAYYSRFEAEFQEMLSGVLNGDPLSIDAAVPGEARLLDDSNYYLVQFTGNDVDATSLSEATRFAKLSSWPEVASRTVLAPRRAHADAIRTVCDAPVSPERTLFLDIETAGLSANTYLFLVGLMYADEQGFHVEQVFARDYTEEKGVLQHVHETMSRFDTVVTYNGASFDLPFIRTRMAVHRLPELPPVGSVDLLHASRRVFREVLPNCRLVTVERHLRGAGRVDDIPSRFIPRAYHEFVRTKDARIMRNVAYHNRMDLFTMAVILNHMSETPATVTESPLVVPVVDSGSAPVTDIADRRTGMH